MGGRGRGGVKGKITPTFPAWAAVTGGSGYSVGGHLGSVVWGGKRECLLLAPHGGSLENQRETLESCQAVCFHPRAMTVPLLVSSPPSKGWDETRLAGVVTRAFWDMMDDVEHLARCLIWGGPSNTNEKPLPEPSVCSNNPQREDSPSSPSAERFRVGVGKEAQKVLAQWNDLPIPTD